MEQVIEHDNGNITELKSEIGVLKTDLSKAKKNN